MKKLALLLVLTTFAAGSACLAQKNQEYQGTEVQGRLSAPSSSPSAAPQATKSASDAMLAADEKGKTITTSFPASASVIYLITKNISGAKGDKVEAAWIADETGKALPAGKNIYISSITLPDTKSYSPSLSVNGPVKGTFPPGKYHVVLTVGSKAIKTLKFTVK